MSWFDENSNDPEIARFAGNDFTDAQGGYNAETDPFRENLPGQPAGYHGLEFWDLQGQSPIAPNNQQGSPNGGLAPGWVRTANGYEYQGTSGPSGSGGFTGGGTSNRPNPNDFGRPGVPDLGNFRSPDPLRPWEETFNAPTAEDATNSPGFQFRLGEGLKALERSAAAKGTLLTGGALKGEQRYAQNAASGEYKDVYNRAYNEYDTRRTNFLSNEANRYNSQRSNLTDQWGFNSDLFGMNRTNRVDDWGIASDYFNQGQAERKTDFDIWNTQDTNAFNKIYQTAMLKKPPSPYSLGY